MNTSIDHILTVAGNLASASVAAQNLGFFCSPESQLVSASSANQIIVFEDHYWELLTVLEATPANAAMRASADLRSGINGICASSRDIDESIAASRAAGMAMSGPISLTRNIVLDGRERALGFRIAHGFERPDGVVLFHCEHKTPDLVWRKEWQSHPNGALGLNVITLASEHANHTAASIAALFGGPIAELAHGIMQIGAGRHQIRVVSPQCLENVEPLIGRKFGAAGILGIRCRSADAALQYAARHGTQVLRTKAGRHFAYAPALGNLVVEFTP